MSKAEPDYQAERRLPDGLTCKACVHGPRCDVLFGAIHKAFTSCDFWPSRFVVWPARVAEIEGDRA